MADVPGDDQSAADAGGKPRVERFFDELDDAIGKAPRRCPICGNDRWNANGERVAFMASPVTDGGEASGDFASIWTVMFSCTRCRFIRTHLSEPLETVDDV